MMLRQMAREEIQHRKELRDTLRAVTRLLAWCQRIVPHFGRRPLSKADVRRLAAATRLRVEVVGRDRMRAPCMMMQHPEGRRLAVRSDLTKWSKRFFVFREVAMLREGRSAATTAHEVFAAVGMYGEGRCWKWVRQELASLNVDWALDMVPVFQSIGRRARVATAARRNAGLARRRGIALRRLGRDVAARRAFVRSGRLAAARGHAWGESVSYSALAALELKAGRFDVARTWALRALDVATLSGVRCAEGMAAHELFEIERAAGRPDIAERYASQAADAYGPRHPNLVNLSHDVAELWAGNGLHARALPVFEASAARFRKPAFVALALSNVAWCAGAVGLNTRFRSAASGARAMLLQPAASLHATDVLLNIARGASAVGDWDAASRAAQDAMSLGLELARPMVVVASQKTLREVAEKKESAVLRADSDSDTAGDRLAARLLHHLALSA